MKKLLFGIASFCLIAALVFPSCKKKEEPVPAPEAKPPAQEQTAPAPEQAPAQQAPAPEQAPQQAPAVPEQAK